MLKKMKKKLTKTAMKLMMNEKVAKTVMTAFQKKNDLNESLARLYSKVELPSLADHESVKYGIEKMRRRIKGLEKEIGQAEFAMEKVESAIERAALFFEENEKADEGKKAKGDNVSVQKNAPPKLTDINIEKPKPITRSKKPPQQSTGKKPSAKSGKPKAAKKTKKAKSNQKAKAGTKTKIAPLGAANSNTPKTGGLLDLNFKKSGKKKKAKSA